MSFMQPVVYQSDYFAIETTHGTEIVPCDLVCRGAITTSKLADYLEGKPLNPEEIVVASPGWVGRMSAPGYLDCTDWIAGKTEQEIRAYLEDMYMEDGESEPWGTPEK